jgi:DNA repair exonuclease SbcCD ATPase subunit
VSRSPDLVSKSPSPAPEPTAAAVDDDALELLQAEAAALKEKFEDVTERADNYDALCRKLVSDEDPDVRIMAEYIGGLLGKEEDLEELQEEHETVKKELESVKKELENQKTSYSELLATTNATEVNLAALAEEHEKIVKLQDTLISRDEEIDSLKAKLREANETIESRVAAAGVGVTLPEGVTLPAPGEEDEIIAMAERELQLMEDLIKEQETYINDLEKELGTAEKAASPAAVEENKCKDETEDEVEVVEEVVDKAEGEPLPK